MQPRFPARPHQRARFALNHYTGPLLTCPLADSLLAARDRGDAHWQGSLDLERSTGQAILAADHWQWQGQDYPYPGKLKDRTCTTGTAGTSPRCRASPAA